MSAGTTYAIAYARVSTPKQAVEGESLDIQASRLRKSIEREGWTLFPKDSVLQEPFSGSTDERPVYEHALQLIKQNPGKIKYFVVANIDRFSREGSMKYQQMKADLATLGVALRDLSGVIRPSVNTLADFGFQYDWSDYSPSRISEIVMAETASYEKSLILTRMVGAQIKLTQDGYHIGPANDGYISMRINADGKKKFAQFPDPDRAHYFREIFRLRADGAYSDAEIVRRINLLGFRTKIRKRWNADRTQVSGHRQGVPLTVKSLQKIVQRPVYCGVVVEKWTHRLPVRARGGESLVSIDVFNKANRGKVHIHEGSNGDLTLLHDWHPDRAIIKRKAYNPAFPFKNLLICPTCSKPLTASYSRGKSGQRFGAYHCSRSHPRYAVSQPTAETAICSLLESLRFTDDFVDNLEGILLDGYRDAERAAVAQTLQANRKTAELKEEKASLVAAFSRAESATMRVEIERQVVAVEERIKAARAIRNDLEMSEDEIRDFISHVNILVEHPAALVQGVEDLREQTALYGLVFARYPTYDEIANGTPQLTATFELFRDSGRTKSRSMTQQGLKWNTWAEEIHRWEEAYPILDTVAERIARGKAAGDLAA